MSSNANLRLVRSVISALDEWCRSNRAPRGGAELKHEVELVLEECLVVMDRSGHVDSELSENLHKALAKYADYLERIR